MNRSRYTLHFYANLIPLGSVWSAFLQITSQSRVVKVYFVKNMYCIDIDTLICQLNFSWIFLVSFLQITSQSRVKACFVQNVYCIDLIHFAFICQSNFSRISLVSFLQITSSPGSRLILKAATPALYVIGIILSRQIISLPIISLSKLSCVQSSVYPVRF